MKQIFWRGLVFLRLTLPLVTDQLLKHVFPMSESKVIHVTIYGVA